MIQTITPNPNIPCLPGWCLAYVNEAFRVPKRYGSATAAWNGSATKHRDWDFPKGVWVPIWFSLKTEPNGHVALLAPDGRVYSTTSPFMRVPTIHPNIAHLINAYAPYNPLTYLGWTEDVEDTRVLAPMTLDYESAPLTPSEEDELASALETILKEIQAVPAAIQEQINVLHKQVKPEAVWAYKNGEDRDAYQILRDVPKDVWRTPIDYRDPATGKLVKGGTTGETVLSYVDTNTSKILDAKTVVASIPDEMAREVLDLLSQRIGGK